MKKTNNSSLAKELMERIKAADELNEKGYSVGVWGAPRYNTSDGQFIGLSLKFLEGEAEYESGLYGIVHPDSLGRRKDECEHLQIKSCKCPKRPRTAPCQCDRITLEEAEEIYYQELLSNAIERYKEVCKEFK